MNVMQSDEGGTATYYAAPNSSWGYYRGAPLYGGGAQAGGGAGPQTQGIGEFAQGQGPSPDISGSWTKTHFYMAILILAEMVVFGFLKKVI